MDRAETRPQSQTPKPLVVRRNGVGTGTTSLLMIFTVLCFATLAMLSLSTAVSSSRIQGRGIEGSKALAAARGEAAEAVAELDGQLLALRQSTGDDAAYPAAAQGAAEALGWAADTAAGTVTLATPVDEQTQLLTTLELQPIGAAERYTVVRQTTELTDGWNPDEGAGVLLS